MAQQGTPLSRELVLDSSVTLSWFFDGEATAATEALLDLLHNGGKAIVPAHWALEACDILLMAERQKRWTVAESSHFLTILGRLPIETDPQTAPRAATASMELVPSLGLTLSDGAYLELAMRRNLPLATLDKELRTASLKTGVPCLPEGP
ncbi:type II toxin-antitoxin system VapC family toxin [Methylacidimicrobium sp. B4]|uniref:type II toxin-antitoxin system VapC family toxin n=1 Tax=Methylacidimicrobium sp. B4 TaxID=2796139 RepID=UPI001A8C1548|nr:type II toxin-antitoxin system VapC family toxin [Methylacidimicrobium sp. B4]QSR85314.1 type II toxin-antitoxin system VapC family toxin [Methylacidimicrobium sp. B4]